jgi:hypothetical protein
MAAPTTAFVKQYQDSITLLAQQLDSRLRSAVVVDTNWTGEEKYYDQYNTDSMVELTTRYQDTPVQAPDHQRRRVTPSYFVSNTLEDPFEALQMLVDPKSAYMQAKMASANRKIDEVIIAALGGTAYTGKTGSTGTSLASTNKVLVQGAGLTKEKILEAKKILDEFEVDRDDRFLVCSAEQFEDVLNSTEASSSDFNTVRALVQGEIDTWIGFKFLHSEQLEVDSSSNRLVYAYQRKGILLAIQKNPEGRVDERPDKNYAWQVYMKLALGSTRLEENRVVQIACSE